MKKSRFTEHQIVLILSEAESGVPVKDVCRKHGISSPTYYKWKSKYGGLEASTISGVGVNFSSCVAGPSPTSDGGYHVQHQSNRYILS